MKSLAAVLLAGAAVAVLLSAWVSRPLFDERLDRNTLEFVSIAPLEEALSFARYRAGDGSLRLLLVTQFREGRVTGLDLEAEGGAPEPDPIALFRAFGYETLAELGRAGATPVTVPAASLELPFRVHEHNVGIGANYREHARESSIAEDPFVFPKLARPTLHSSEVARPAGSLLDYEAELGLVLLDDFASGAAPPRLGLVLANELTDRWALVRNLDRDGPMGTTGFADGKSGAGFAPIGPLLVIPRDLEAFYPRIELRLHLNGQLRQRDRAGNMTWAPREILRQVFERADAPYRYRGAAQALLPAGRRLPAGSIVFSGTPAGVIFKPLNLWNPWVYLRPGDEVVVAGDFLGVIRNPIR